MLATCRSVQGTVDEEGHAELDTLLGSVLQAASDRDKSLTERVQQQQLDLQALHCAVERGTSDREEQHACLEQVQVCPNSHGREKRLSQKQTIRVHMAVVELFVTQVCHSDSCRHVHAFVDSKAEMLWAPVHSYLIDLEKKGIKTC